MSRSNLSAGQVVGGFRIRRKIAQGGMGEVYEAWDEELQRRIAIKILSVNSGDHSQFEERFKSEGRALARLRHPNIVTLHTLGNHEGNPYMAMEYIDGMAMDKFIANHPCGLPDLLKLFKQIVEGMIVAHEAGIIHRDIKPQNIVVDKSMTAKLIDFGIAKSHHDSEQVKTATDILMGTVNYLAPEIVMGREASKQSDIYSLGLVLYNMLTGVSPFHGRSNFEVLEKIRSSTLSFNPRIDYLLPEEVKHLVFRMTTKSTQTRFADMRDVQSALAKIDPSKWPAELRLSVFPKLILSNGEAVRKKCTEAGFDSAEGRLIMNLAADIQCRALQASPASDAIYITDDALNDAIKRFNEFRETMTSQRHRRLRRPRLLVYAGAATALACAAAAIVYFVRAESPASPAPARLPGSFDAPPQSYDLPKYKEGQTTTYHERLINRKTGETEERTWTWTLANNKAGKLMFKSDGGIEQMRLESPFFPPLNAGGDPFESADEFYIDGDHRNPFPLSLKKRTTTKLVFLKNGGKTEEPHDWTCAVEKESELVIQAGKFQTIKVVCADERDLSRQAKYHYSPAIGRVIRSERKFKTPKGEFLFHTELVGYRD